MGGAAAAEILDCIPDEGPLLVQVPFLKARPHTEGDRRFVYCEPSNEVVDTEGERIAKAALVGSRELYLTKGNIDIDHISLLGHQWKIPNPREWEIGIPLEVRESPDGLFMKGEIYRGNERADWWWHSVTEQVPAMRWFPSVGGWPVDHRIVADPRTGKHRKVITKANWVNTAFAREPKNLSMSGVRVTPFGAFAKAVAYAMENAVECETVGGVCTCRVVAKGITAGYGTDVAALSGGAALRRESIGGATPDDDAIARYLRSIRKADGCEHARPPMTHDKMTAHFEECERFDRPKARRHATRLLTAWEAQRRKKRAAGGGD